MRIPTLFLLLFAALRLNAQEQKEPYYLQQAPVQQMLLDCYAQYVEEGLDAQQRGDCRLALRWFRDAKSCPEATKMPGRMEELDRLIAACEGQTDKTVRAQKEPARTAGTSGDTGAAKAGVSGRRRFQPSREFLTYDKPECFDITCKEAERAYRGGYWDDAAALYRAAKNCADADQADRQAANQRIETCRAASQNELRRKEQEAVRQARHALAANRANDASQLLRAFDRSLAYRLADFANEYIAPDDNDACRQAMFDALYYSPSVHSGIADQGLRIPLCYQLGDNLDRELQIHYLGKPGNRKIVAYARSRHLLFRWDAESFEPETPVALEDTTLLFCDVVPDNRTLLFVSKTAYLFWRSPRETFRLPVESTSLYCFDEKGQTFYFLNAAEMQVNTLNLRDIFAQRKGGGSRAAAQAVAGLYLDPGLLRMAVANDRFYAGYRDSIAVYAQGDSRGNRRMAQVLYIGKPVRNYYNGELPYLWLKPKEGAAIFANDSAAFYFKFSDTAEYAVIAPHTILPGFPVMVSADARLAATYFIGAGSEKDSRLYLYDTETGLLKYAALIPANHTDMYLKTGVFDPDNRYFATTTSGGRLEVWTLDEGPGQRIAYLGPNAYFVLNADGTKLYAWRNDSLMQMPADNPWRISHAIPAPPNSATGMVAGQNWLAYRSGAATLAVTDQLGKRRWLLPSPPGYNSEVVAAFNPDETQMACLNGTDSVNIYALADGSLLTSRGFGGAVHQLHFVPESGEILVVQEVEAEENSGGQTVIKLWNPAGEQGAKLRTVRLHGYNTVEVALAERNGLIAFTDGLDIRVFQRNDLLNESTRIRQYGLRMVTALAFHPEGNMLAAGYDDGSIVFWDIGTGQARFTWARPPIRESEDFPPVIRLRFTDGGRRLEMLLFGYVLLTRDVTLSLVRAAVQTDYRKLIAFLPNQIREYNLEQALDYPDNFSRLAASGDLPLIRSFFDYYRESAVYSNNIQRVGNYCNRAFVLFGQLDAATQKVLRPILLDMYDDYHWKLLLRGQNDEAEKVARSMMRDFGSPLSATLASAHSALLRDDRRPAARLYAEWALRAAATNDGVLPSSALDSLHARLRQLLEYDLIKPEQLNCLCDLFGFFPSYTTLCETTPSETVLTELDATTRLRWDNFRRLNRAEWTKNNPEKVQLLTGAMDNVRILQRQNKTVYQQELEQVTLALQQAYLQWAVFEQSAPRAMKRYKQAIDGLKSAGPFETPGRETTRLSRLVAAYLYAGEAYMGLGQTAAVLANAQAGLQVADQLLRLVGADSVQYRWYRNEYHLRLYNQTASARLLEGDANAALQAFEQARDASSEGINDLYFGHVALLQGNETDALLNYGDLYNEELLAQTLFTIQRMARRLPAQQSRLLAFAARLHNARLAATEQRFDSLAVQYYLAEQNRQYFAALEQWDSTLAWNGRVLANALQLLHRDSNSLLWQGKWLDALLSQTYYLLLQKNGDTARFSQIIALANEAEQYCEQGNFYYENRYLLKTNLAHAHWLRQQPGDRERALQYYGAFLQNDLDHYDVWELLLKDFRDIVRAGIQWPDLQALIRQIRPPGAIITPEDWAELKISPAGEN